jgi:hypothetical protein
MANGVDGIEQPCVRCRKRRIADAVGQYEEEGGERDAVQQVAGLEQRIGRRDRIGTRIANRRCPA